MTLEKIAAARKLLKANTPPKDVAGRNGRVGRHAVPVSACCFESDRMRGAWT